MEDITLACLRENRYGSKDFSKGEKVRLYITYWGICTEIEVREGIVINPKAKRNVMGYYKRPALKLKVEKAGRVVDRKPNLEDVFYTRSYQYFNIGLVERLEDS